MKRELILLGLSLLLFVGWSCEEENSGEEGGGVVEPADIQIQDFIWGGMNVFYLWQESVPKLADDRFSTQTEYESFLADNPVPEDFFESLIYNRQTVDFWSWIVDDYIALENQFAGISKSNGVDFGLIRFSSASNDILGYVRYIMPNSDAEGKDIKRGDLFATVDGQQLTIENYRDLLFGDNDSYTLGLARIQNGSLNLTGETVSLTKFEYTENPILITKVIEEGGRRIGYLLYNGFTRGFDNELNQAFGQFKNEGITDLIVDFRYNPGGSVSTAIAMGSMITGQFEGEVFNREEWNSKIQAELEQTRPEWLENRFVNRLSDGTEINSLNLTSLHVITTRSSASASELVINALLPYINVTIVGEQTSGKYTASITLYDSENFGRDGASPDHFYAMQPIVLQSVNSLGNNDKNGFEPNIARDENVLDMGILGEPNEPLLRTAINDIIGSVSKSETVKGLPFETLTNSKMFLPQADNMYVDKEELRTALSPKVVKADK